MCGCYGAVARDGRNVFCRIYFAPLGLRCITCCILPWPAAMAIYIAPLVLVRGRPPWPLTTPPKRMVIEGVACLRIFAFDGDRDLSIDWRMYVFFYGEVWLYHSPKGA